MATKITTGFSYNGKDPIDGPRSKFSSVSAMKNYNEAFIDEGHMSITNIGTAQAPVWKRFEWFSANTVNPTYGRWRAVTTEIPLASSSTIGGIKIGFDPAQPDLDRPVELAQDGKAYIALLDATSTSRGIVLKTSYTAGSIDLTDDESVPTVKATKAIADNAAETAAAAALNAKIWIGTETQYNAIVTKDADTLYFVYNE